LESQRHCYACYVPSAEDGMAACQRDQRRDRIALLLLDPLADLGSPGLIHPCDHRERQLFLVPELVVQRAARVAGVASDLLEHEIAVAVAREPPRRRLEQGAARARAALRLGAP